MKAMVMNESYSYEWKLLVFITCSAVVFDADWSMGVRYAAIHSMYI